MSRGLRVVTQSQGLKPILENPLFNVLLEKLEQVE